MIQEAVCLIDMDFMSSRFAIILVVVIHIITIIIIIIDSFSFCFRKIIKISIF